jgi:NADH:ubiquinone oxidoreductase subunit K
MFILNIFFLVSFSLLLIGLYGFITNKLNILIFVVCLEIIFYSINLLFLLTNFLIFNIMGSIVAFFIIVTSASEAALALGLIFIFFKSFWASFLLNLDY